MIAHLSMPLSTAATLCTMGPSKKSPKDQSAAAKKLLAKAPSILQEVDEAVIFKNYPARELPSFEPSGTFQRISIVCIISLFSYILLINNFLNSKRIKVRSNPWCWWILLSAGGV